MLKDSGERKEFETGAVREITDEKGRCDLVHNIAFADILGDVFYEQMDSTLRLGDERILLNQIYSFIRSYYDSVEDAYLEVAKHYARGAKKYSERNMEKGLPWHCFIDSALRHYTKMRRGDTDEPHREAVLWNLLTLHYTMLHHPELNDLPVEDKNDF